MVARMAACMPARALSLIALIAMVVLLGILGCAPEPEAEATGAEAVGGAGRALVEVFWDGLVSEGEYADGYGTAGGMSEALWTSQQEAVVVAAEMIACAARGGYRPACLIGADREGFLEAWALGGAVSRLDSARSVYEACIQQTSG